MSKNHPKKCLDCKKTFFAKNLRAVYCSDLCRVRSNRRKFVTVTENPDVGTELQLSKEEISLKEMQLAIEKQQGELSALEQQLKGLEIDIQEKEAIQQGIELQRRGLSVRRNLYMEKHGQVTNEWNEANNLFKKAANTKSAFASVMTNLAAAKQMNQCAHHYDYSRQIKSIDEELTLINSKENSLLLRMLRTDANSLKETKAIKTKSIAELKQQCEKLRESIQNKKKLRALSLLKDEHGFVSAKDVQHINFSDRITLHGDMGALLGALEKNKCAITLTGRQGSGKTYFCFDLMSKFIELKYKVAYFSCEEGITQLTKEKLYFYNLQNEENFKIREEAGLEDIRKFAGIFDVIVIDSWGKLNADISEFDKLRLSYPDTIIVSIFQQTSSGQMRGGTMAAFDAGINIETSVEKGKRIAVCTKNRYGRTGIRYFIDDRKTENS